MTESLFGVAIDMAGNFGVDFAGKLTASVWIVFGNVTGIECTAGSNLGAVLAEVSVFTDGFNCSVGKPTY